MGIDKPTGGADRAPDRPREPEHPVPRRENPAARERPATPQDAGAPVTRQERAAEAEERRLARIARRAEGSHPEAAREPRPGDKGVITHFRGPTVDLYTDGTRWASGDVVRAREAERQRREGRADVPKMREQGRSVIGDKPDDASDLPPTRKDLMESDNPKRSRIDRLRRNVEDQDVLGDLHDTSAEQTNIWQKNLDHTQPQGHPVQVQRDSPHAAPMQHSQPTAGDYVGASIAAGMLAIEGWRSLHRLLTHKKEVD